MPHTVTTATAIADQINADFTAGRITDVNGRRITSQYGRKPANAWGNGTVSVTVKGRSKGKTGTVYAKTGQALHTA
jgi:hypothetical protein